MTRTALILGATGRFGRHMADALTHQGWTVRRFDRKTRDLQQAAQGADLIVNAWNPPYSQWAASVPILTQQVIAAAKASGAAVMIPGNIYVYGTDLPPVLTDQTPHRATHPLGQIRRTMEAAYRDAGVKTIILRSGDYLDTAASGNWFDQVIAKGLSNGRISYPGPLDRAHAWAFLPDIAQAGALLAAQLGTLPRFTDVTFEGTTLSGNQMATALSRATGRPVTAKRMWWLPLHLARPFWPEAKHLFEMRYLWNRPHRLDGSALAGLIETVPQTATHDILRAAAAPLLQKSMSTQTSRWADASATASANGPSVGQITPASITDSVAAGRT